MPTKLELIRDIESIIDSFEEDLTHGLSWLLSLKVSYSWTQARYSLPALIILIIRYPKRDKNIE